MQTISSLVQCLALVAIAGCAAPADRHAKSKQSFVVSSEGKVVYGPIRLEQASFSGTLEVQAEPCSDGERSPTEVVLSFSSANASTLAYSCSTFQKCTPAENISVGEASATQINGNGVAEFSCGALDVAVYSTN